MARDETIGYNSGMNKKATKRRPARPSARSAKQDGMLSRALETVEKLPWDDQETLIALLQKRRIARRRAELVKEVEQSRREFELGLAKPCTPESLMREILS